MPRVVVTAIRAEFSSERAIGTAGSSNSSRMFDHWRWAGKNVHAGDVMSCSLESPFRSSR